MRLSLVTETNTLVLAKEKKNKIQRNISDISVYGTSIDLAIPLTLGNTSS